MPPDPAGLTIDDRWIRAQRPPKLPVDPLQPYAVQVEDERTAAGNVVPVGTIFITNRECPFSCLMCDLWRYTTDETVPAGSIDTQVRQSLKTLDGVRHLKLYNAGNFFDDRAVGPRERTAVAERLAGFHTVVIENHPRLVDRRLPGFRDRLEVDRLEVAMGLETADPVTLARLNKRMTLGDFERATAVLLGHGIGVRAFILLRPPFCSESEGVEQACLSVEYAFSIGVECCAIIPARPGNGALDVLAAQGLFGPPRLESLETAVAHGVALGRGRVFADLWDIERFVACPDCAGRRIARLRTMNLTQTIPGPVACSCH